MIDIRRTLLSGLPKDLLFDLEDRLRAEAIKAREVIRKEFALSPKRSRGLEGQARFRLQEEGFEEVVQLHGGQLMTEGVITGTDLKFFQPFARFQGLERGVILGFASMPEKGSLPPKNMSRSAGVTLNVNLQINLFTDESTPQPTDIFALFLTARDRERAGLIEEIAIGVIGGDYREYVFYESLDDFLRGYGSEPEESEGPIKPQGGDKNVKLRKTRKPFDQPEKRPDKDVRDGSDD